MKSLLALRRFAVAACLLLAFVVAAPAAWATHLRGGTITWKVTATTTNTYTVQFTFQESQRWSYPGTAGSCNVNPSSCPALNSSVSLQTFSGGTFNFGDGTSASPTGTVTSINQASDYLTATFVFTHAYSTTTQPSYTAYFLANNRISTLQVGHDDPEKISTVVTNHGNGSPTAATPAILSVPLLATVNFNVSSIVTDIDPSVNLSYRLSTISEMYNQTYTDCLNTSLRTTSTFPQPPGFSISTTGVVTWDTSRINANPLAGYCYFPAPLAGTFWAAQIMVEAYDKTTNALVASTPIDLMMEFISPVGALPTISISPSGTQTVSTGTPVAFKVTGNSTNPGTKITLNASGVPQGAVTTGLNATVTPPTTSDFNWTPTSAQTGTYVVTYTVTDSNLQQATASQTVVVASLPTISCSNAISVAYGQTGSVSATLYDQNNEALNLVWKVDGTTVETDNNITAFPTSAVQTLTQNFGAVGPHTVTATATDPHGVSVNCSATATVTQANQTITFGSIPDTTYGAPDYVLGASSDSGLPVSYTALGACMVTSLNTVHTTGAGPCQITASQPGNTNYNAATPVVQSFNIAPAAVTLTAGSGSAQYDGSMKTPSACTVSGAFTGDVTCTNNPATVGPDVGTTSIVPVPAGSNLANFAITVVPGSYSISQAPSVTVVSCPVFSVYDGTAQTRCTATVTGAGGLNQLVPVTYTSNIAVGVALAQANFPGDLDHTASSGTGSFLMIPAVVTATAGSYSGTFDGNAHALTACTVGANNYDGLTCTNNPAGPVGPNVGSGAVTPVIVGNTSNYTVTLNPGAWSITQASSSVSISCPASVNYNGTAQAPCTATVTGPGLSQSVTVTYSNNVGVGTASASASFAGDANHTGSNNSTTFSIAPAPLSVTAANVSRAYGAANPAFTGTINGIVNGDAITATYSTTATPASAVGSYAIVPTLAGAALSNYSVTVNNGTLSVTQAPLVVTPADASRVFGAPNPALTGTVTGIVNGDPITATYSTTATPASDPGPYPITASLNDPAGKLANYSVTLNTGTLTIAKANQTITWATPAPITYATPLSSAQLNATVSVPGPGAAGAITYSPAAGTVLDAGIQTLTVNVAGTVDYNPASATVQLVVNKAQTAFTGLSNQTITLHTGTATFSGMLSSPTATPAEQPVSVTLNGVTQTAITNANGTFSATFDTSTLPVSSTGYVVSYGYAGGPDFNPASATSNLTVAYGVCLNYDATQVKNSGSTYPIKVIVCDAAHNNVATADMVLTGIGWGVSSPTNTPLPDAGKSNGNGLFRNTGSFFMWNLKTTDMPAGSYNVYFSISGDPTLHSAPFAVN